MTRRKWTFLIGLSGLAVLSALIWMDTETPTADSGAMSTDSGASVNTPLPPSPAEARPTPHRTASERPERTAPLPSAPPEIEEEQPTEGQEVPAPAPVPSVPVPEPIAPPPPPPETFGAELSPEQRHAEEEDLIPKSTWPVTADGIRQAVGEQVPELLECYEAWVQAHPGLSGRMLARFRIEPTRRHELARITGVRLGRSTLNHRLLEGCVLNVLSSLRFESPESGATTVSYPLVFDEGDTSPGGSP